jgi:hypothetical protein
LPAIIVTDVGSKPGGTGVPDVVVDSDVPSGSGVAVREPGLPGTAVAGGLAGGEDATRELGFGLANATAP